MFVRIVEHRDQAPQGDSVGSTIWLGGQNPGQEETSVSASVLVDMVSELEIGTWYKFNDFSELVSRAQPTASEAWTTISIPQDGSEGRFEAAIQYNQEAAARLIANAAVSFAENLQNREDLWVRVE